MQIELGLISLYSSIARIGLYVLVTWPVTIIAGLPQARRV